MDSRVGEYFLNAGPGFGGSCFKKDISNLIYICNHYGLYEVASYWEQVIAINLWQQKRITSIIVNKLYGTITGKKIAILGFAFKSNTNDTRESPAINICRDLLEEGCNLSIYDPKVNKSQIDNDLSFKCDSDKTWEVNKSVLSAVKDADAIIFLTEWEEFFHLEFAKIYDLMRPPCWVFDTRNIINVNELKKIGFNVWKLGDGSLN